ncbi:macrolide ABC transporter permease [Rufibacter radiotolerans]|uniref:Macrolide ABC transporter permease n=1 Tax=Rufibacter radiotolerans TaxID=1379910 RepID=A0A0H4W340_9BACT|nr:ABC transporter permease [Rufibacter radiotolerans]AKQ44861.1 macrolide ABC transporter permease [Rufibacter radiotolerans]
MFKNYFKVAYRNLIRHKGFSIINIAGLTLGVTACLLIGLFVYDELQYDKFLPEGDQVYRVYNDQSAEESAGMVSPVPPMFGATLEQSIPEVDKVARILMLQYDANNLVEASDKKIYENGRFFADPSFFEVFQLPFVYGSPEKALADPTSIVISDKFAQRVFGKADPVGKKVAVNQTQYLVKGVFSTAERFHLPVNFVLPMAAAEIPPERMQNWGWQQFYTYVKLKKGANAQAAQTKLREIVSKQIDPDKNAPFRYRPMLQPLHEVYLYSAGFKYDQNAKGNITYVKALSVIAVFILLIACFNFVNLATAKSLQRAKEVGVRKAIGASRGQLMLQFLSETVMLTLISVIFSAALTSLLLPSLNAFTDKQMTFNVFTNFNILLLLLVLTLVVGVLAGLYPAMVLSGFKPVKVLKSAVVVDSKVGKIQWLRHGLIVVQLALSIFLIISASIVYKQVGYLHNKDLGFNKDQIMFFQMRGQNMFENHETFKSELRKATGVKDVSIGYGFPGDATAGDRVIVPRNGEKEYYGATLLMVDFNYINTLDVQVLAGRPFSKEYPTDADHAYMINETAVRELGYGTPEKALGQPLLWPTWDKQDSLKEGKIIGVVKDFHYKSLYDKMEPVVMQIYPNAAVKVAVKVEPENVAGTISQVKTVWDKFSPEYPLEYMFMDDNFEKMYKAEDKLKSLLTIFTGIAIFIGSLGLFGLAAYAAERRKKEIGIRKILGAETSSIVALLSKDFMKLVLLAAFIAIPVAWYAMNKWLEDFAYRIEIPLWVFGAALLLAGLVAFLTVSFQALKAATANPVKNLRMD